MPHQEGHNERVLRHVQLVSDMFGISLDRARILDLACLEGGFTFELAMQGADAAGLEGRASNATLNVILNSKGWRLLEKYRKIRNGIRSLFGRRNSP